MILSLSITLHCAHNFHHFLLHIKNPISPRCIKSLLSLSPKFSGDALVETDFAGLGNKATMGNIKEPIVFKLSFFGGKKAKPYFWIDFDSILKTSCTFFFSSSFTKFGFTTHYNTWLHPALNYSWLSLKDRRTPAPYW